MSISEIVAIVKDLATGGAAIVAAIVAMRGLNTWRRQLKGNAEYELARRLLRATYMVRDRIRLVRSPLMTVGEISAAYKAAGKDDEARAHGSDDERVTYESRWSRLSEARADFQTALLEAEALWGPDVRDAGHELLACIGALHSAIGRWLSRSDRPIATDEQIAGIIWETRIEEYGSFSKRLDTAVEQLEEQLRPHLKN